VAPVVAFKIFFFLTMVPADCPKASDMGAIRAHSRRNFFITVYLFVANIEIGI